MQDVQATMPLRRGASNPRSRSFAGSEGLGRFELLDEHEIDALQPEWRDLWQRASGDYLMQTYDWAQISLRHPPDRRPRRAFCVVGRKFGRADVIWPFVVYANNHLRLATMIAAEWGDYTSPLVADGPDAAERTRTAWLAARRLVPCDVFDLRFVRQSSVLHDIIANDASPKEMLYKLEAPWIALKGFADWDGYWQTIDADHRRDLGRKERRLAELGAVQVHEITDPARGRDMIDWMIHHKRIWLDHAAKEDKIRLRTQEYPQFLKAQVDAFFPNGQCLIFALTLNDRVLAVDLVSIDKMRLEWNVGTFDYEFRRFSPGLVLKRHHVRWAWERGLDYDMRLGGGQHKRFWGNRVEQTTTWRVANSAIGRGYILMKRGIKMLRH